MPQRSANWHPVLTGRRRRAAAACGRPTVPGKCPMVARPRRTPKATVLDSVVEVERKTSAPFRASQGSNGDRWPDEGRESSRSRAAERRAAGRQTHAPRHARRRDMAAPVRS